MYVYNKLSLFSYLIENINKIEIRNTKLNKLLIYPYTNAIYYKEDLKKRDKLIHQFYKKFLYLNDDHICTNDLHISFIVNCRCIFCWNENLHTLSL